MKKTCNGCKAFIYSDYSAKCELGYEIENHERVKVLGDILLRFRPLGTCPKPKTNNEYTKLLENRIYVNSIINNKE